MLSRRARATARLQRGGVLLAFAATLSACSVFEGDKIDYKSSRQGPTLEVPPDLTQLQRDARYSLQGSAVTASAYQGAQTSAQAVPAAAQAVGDIRVERQGNQRWLVVARPPEQLWDRIRTFWTDSGFTLTVDQTQLGILETDWAENRAKLPQDIIRQTIGRLFDALYSTGERDKFRTRLERRADGGTEIYITHRGMQEVYTTNAKDATIWQPRPADVELETEFLRRLMIRLGAPQEEARQVATRTEGQGTARVTGQGAQTALEIAEGFDVAWRRVGVALDRTGFTVEDRDRSQGVYFVRYVEPSAGRAEPGFFARLFGSGASAAVAPLKYRIAVRRDGEQRTVVSVLDDKGAPDASANAQRIVKVIADDLR